MTTAETEAPASQRGQFGHRVNQQGIEIEALKAKVESLEQEVSNLRGLIDPEEINFIWENMRELTEVLSALRRTNGLPPLAEFSGTKARRRKAERALRT